MASAWGGRRRGARRRATSRGRRVRGRVNTLLTEISELVALFHGHVLKYTGDGLIAYFAEPTFIIKSDAAVDCAFCVRRLIYNAVNPELENAGLPTIDVRLGLDGGEAAIEILGSPRTRRHADLIGDVVSLACRIESQAGTGEIFLGETVERNLHFRWREMCTSVELPRAGPTRSQAASRIPSSGARRCGDPAGRASAYVAARRTV